MKVEGGVLILGCWMRLIRGLCSWGGFVVRVVRFSLRCKLVKCSELLLLNSCKVATFRGFSVKLRRPVTSAFVL